MNTVTSELEGLSGLTWWPFVTFIAAIPVWIVVVAAQSSRVWWTVASGCR